jgi:hypothetical protein
LPGTAASRAARSTDAGVGDRIGGEGDVVVDDDVAAAVPNVAAVPEVSAVPDAPEDNDTCDGDVVRATDGG